MAKIHCWSTDNYQHEPKPASYEDHLQSKLAAAASQSQKSITGLAIFKATGTEYADVAAIDGVRYMAGSNVDSRWAQAVWALLLALSLGMIVVVFNPIWHNYMKQATLNLQETITMPNFQFPAITFCNFNMWKRSMAGHNYAGYMQFDLKYRHSVSEYGKEVCSSTPFYKTVANFTYDSTWYDTVFQDPIKLGRTFGYHSLMLNSPTSYATVQSCMFKNRKLSDYECYSAFQNRLMSDSRVCFTFNPSEAVRKYTIQQIDPSIPVFPSPIPGIVDFNVKARGKATAVELLLNVQEYEYCSTGSTDASGMEIQVHSRDVQPLISDLMNNVVKLSPGKDVTIVIEEQHTVRETEPAGWCSSEVPLKYYEYMDSYDRDACYMECLTDKVIEKCKCYPIFAPAAALVDQIRELRKIYNDTQRRIFELTKTYCVNRGGLCMAQTFDLILSEKSIQEECSHCKVPCFEKTYRVEKTESNFPSSNNYYVYRDMKYPTINYTALRQLTSSESFIGTTRVLENLDKRTYGTAERFTDVEEARQNLIHLRIQLKSMTVLVNRETFVVSLSQLTTQFGGALGLFIGASALSIAEIVFWCCIGIRNVCKNNRI